MAFYDRFFDRLADIVDEHESNRRTSGRRRYSDGADSGYRYSRGGLHGDLKKKQPEDEEELRRYAGLYRSVRERGREEGDDNGDPNILEAYERITGSENDPYADGYAPPRGFNPLKRRKYMREERERLSGASRPGHVYDDIKESLEGDGESGDIAPTFGIGRRMSEESRPDDDDHGRGRHERDERGEYDHRGNFDTRERPARGRRRSRGGYIGSHDEREDYGAYGYSGGRGDRGQRGDYGPPGEYGHPVEYGHNGKRRAAMRRDYREPDYFDPDYPARGGRGRGGYDQYDSGGRRRGRNRTPYDRQDYDHAEYDRRGYGGREREYERGRRGEYDYPPDAPLHGKKRLSMAARLALIVFVTGFIVVQTIILGSVTTKPRPPQEDIPEVDYSGSTVNGEYAPNNPETIYTQQAQQLVAVMSAEQKVGQLIIASSRTSEDKTLSDDDFCALVSATDASGVLLRQTDVMGRTKDGLTGFIEKLQQASGSGELFVMAEEEGGAKVVVSSNSALRNASFRSAQAMYVSGGLDLISEDAAEKSAFLKELGINVNIAPMCDVVTSTGGFMYSRSFGKGASDTSEYVSRVTAQMKEKNIGCVLKFFPGYGNSTGETRNGLVVISTVATVIRERDMLPFKAGIDAKADAVMMAHAIVTAIDDTAPASLSPVVIEMLRKDLGFDGVIMSEPLDDEGLSEYTGGEDVSVRALLAGIDLLLSPADAPATRSAVLEAVYNGTIPQERLDQAVSRILRWKLRLGIIAADG